MCIKYFTVPFPSQMNSGLNIALCGLFLESSASVIFSRICCVMPVLVPNKSLYFLSQFFPDLGTSSEEETKQEET